MESQIKESSEHKDSSDQEKYEINSVSQRNDSCVIDIQVPTCSKYTTDPDYHVRKDYDITYSIWQHQTNTRQINVIIVTAF